ncbi:MAG: DUF58 domain-containing protein [Saprospiraceae bacterium]|nr:DUF58 domain-containing protein [Saprospiraceae bacterium]
MSFFDTIDLKQHTNLDLIAQKVVEGFIIGLHKSPFHGFSVEFAEHRLYQPGENIRNIDWKVYARSDKFFTKKYEEETNLRARIVIDVSSSMYFPGKEVYNDARMNKLQWSCLAAAALTYLLKRQRDAYGLTLFDEEMVYHSEVKSSSAHQKLLFSQLDRYIYNQPVNKRTAATESLHLIADAIHKRSLVIIFSDMLEDPEKIEPMVSALQHFKHNKHEVILFHVMDTSKELNFEFENRPYEFIDMESGEKLRLQSNELKKEYTTRMNHYLDELRLRTMQYNIDFVSVDINKDYDQILQSYLIKREKMRI